MSKQRSPYNRWSAAPHPKHHVWRPPRQVGRNALFCYRWTPPKRGGQQSEKRNCQERTTSRQAVFGFLTMILPAIKNIQIKQHIVEGNYVATVFDMETTDGTSRVFDRIRILDGELKEIHSFYYAESPEK
jgi:hypothetical protein